MFMNKWINSTNISWIIIGVLTIVIIWETLALTHQQDVINKQEEQNVTINNTEYIASEQWGGAVPMKIYTIFDRDTGVYYAVTEKGGICVMQTMSGETKLVDQGDGSLIHPNQGE